MPEYLHVHSDLVAVAVFGVAGLGDRCPSKIGNSNGDGVARKRLSPIFACVDQAAADWSYDSTVLTRVDLIEMCTNAESASSIWDAFCVGAEAPPEVCDQSYESFEASHLPACGKGLVDAELDRTCVFGTHYSDLRRRPGAVVILHERTLTADSPISPIEEQQIVKAVQATAYDDVTNVAEAFAAVEDNIVNLTELWDASNRKAFTSFEVGAGDNSFGMIFAYGTTTQAALINDGDIYDCDVFWGKEMRTCADHAQCAEGHFCVGARLPMHRCRRGH